MGQIEFVPGFVPNNINNYHSDGYNINSKMMGQIEFVPALRHTPFKMLYISILQYLGQNLGQIQFVPFIFLSQASRMLLLSI